MNQFVVSLPAYAGRKSISRKLPTVSYLALLEVATDKEIGQENDKVVILLFRNKSIYRMDNKLLVFYD